MRPENRDAASLLDALEAARRIVTYIEGMSMDEYLSSSLKRAAVERELILIGEALNRLSQETRNANLNISIPAIVGSSMNMNGSSTRQSFRLPPSVYQS